MCQPQLLQLPQHMNINIGININNLLHSDLHVLELPRQDPSWLHVARHSP